MDTPEKGLSGKTPPHSVLRFKEQQKEGPLFSSEGSSFCDPDPMQVIASEVIIDPDQDHVVPGGLVVAPAKLIFSLHVAV